MHVHGTHAGHLRHLRRPRAARHRRRPLPVGRQALLRLRARQLPDLPLRRRRHHDPRAKPPTPDSLCALADEAPTLFFGLPDSSLPFSTPRSSRPVFGSVRATVTAGEALPADLQRRFSERFGHPVLDGIGSPSCCTSSSPTPSPHSQPAPPVGRRRLRGQAARRRRQPSRRPAPPATSTSAARRRRPATGSRRATTAALRPEGLAAHRRHVREIARTTHGRSSAATDDMIKAGGIWVSPTEVESTLVTHPDVLEAWSSAPAPTRASRETVAFVGVQRAGHSIETTDLDTHCRQHMATFKRPQDLVVDELRRRRPARSSASSCARLLDQLGNVLTACGSASTRAEAPAHRCLPL